MRQTEKLRGDVEKITIYLPARVHRMLKVEAALRSLSMGAVVEDALVSREQAGRLVDRTNPPGGLGD